MRRIIFSLVGLTLSAAVVGSAITVAPANAAVSRAKLSFVNAHVGAGEGVTAQYSARRVPEGGQVLLQKAVGTAGVWKKVRRVSPGVARTATLIAPVMGRHAYRVVIRSAAKRIVARSAAILYSYGTVELATIDQNETRTVTLNDGMIYRYVWSAYHSSVNVETLKVERTSCRSLTLSAAFKQASSYTNTLPTTVTVVQEAADPVTMSVLPNSTASMTTGVVPGTAWALQVTVPRLGLGQYAYGNGTASCFTPTGSV